LRLWSESGGERPERCWCGRICRHCFSMHGAKDVTDEGEMDWRVGAFSRGFFCLNCACAFGKEINICVFSKGGICKIGVEWMMVWAKLFSLLWSWKCLGMEEGN
jgi:hypothetical protein